MSNVSIETIDITIFKRVSRVQFRVNGDYDGQWLYSELIKDGMRIITSNLGGTNLMTVELDFGREDLCKTGELERLIAYEKTKIKRKIREQNEPYKYGKFDYGELAKTHPWAVIRTHDDIAIAWTISEIEAEILCNELIRRSRC